MSRWIAIAAMAANRTIGRNGDLPWHLPEDLRWFKEATRGHSVLMGRKTYEAIGRPLPGRETFVLSRTLQSGRGFVAVRTMDEVEAAIDPAKILFVIGGAEIYGLAFPRCDELYITHVEGDYDGDTFLPPFEDAFAPAETLMHGDDFTIIRYVHRG